MRQNLDAEIRDEVDEQTMFAFFENLHIDLNVAIEKRESFDATTDRETISVQDIDFLDVAIDEKSDEISKKDVLFERSRTIADANIEKDRNFDDDEDEKMIDRDDKTEEIKNETTNCSTDFDFFA